MLLTFCLEQEQQWAGGHTASGGSLNMAGRGPGLKKEGSKKASGHFKYPLLSWWFVFSAARRKLPLIASSSWLPVHVFLQLVTNSSTTGYLSVYVWLPVLLQLVTCTFTVGYLSVFSWLLVCVKLVTCLSTSGYLSVFRWLPVCLPMFIFLSTSGYLSGHNWLPACLLLIICLSTL